MKIRTPKQKKSASLLGWRIFEGRWNSAQGVPGLMDGSSPGDGTRQSFTGRSIYVVDTTRFVTFFHIFSLVITALSIAVRR